MPDISMCQGGECPRKNECYRFRAVPSRYQTYFCEPPMAADGTCTRFYQVRPGDRLDER